jgi:hypothetical protein
MSVVNDLNVNLTKEQLFKLIDMYTDFIDLVPPYQRF